MTTKLIEIEQFNNDHEFKKVKAHIEEMVSTGLLIESGLDPTELFRFVEIYKTIEGDVWHLAIPDHAFRGYLKKAV